MHSSLQNIRPAQMQNLTHDKTFVNKQSQQEMDHRQVHLNAVKETEKTSQKLTEAIAGEELKDYLKEKREQEKKKKKKREEKKKGVYKVKNTSGDEEVHVDIKV